MLDAGIMRELAGVLVFEDDRAKAGYYLLPKQPRVEREGGAPHLSLVVYGRTVDGEFRPSGGLFSCTVSLALTAQEAGAAKAALQAELAQKAEAAGERPPRVELLAPDWQAGQVALRLLDDLQLSGRPSLTGSNACSFSQNLSASQAKSLEELFSGDDEAGAIRYEVEIRGAAPTRSTLQVEQRVEVRDSGQSAAASLAGGFQIEQGGPSAVKLILEGPLWPGKAAAGVSPQRVSL